VSLNIFCVNCGNKLPSSYTVNYCPKCRHVIKSEKRILKYTSDGRPVFQDHGTSKENTRPSNTSPNTTKQKQPMSTKKAIFYIVMFIFWVSLAIYFAYTIYQQLVVGPAEDAYYESYGCYISDGGSMYTCPNGLPPERP
jgi:hypothetical protein